MSGIANHQLKDPSESADALLSWEVVRARVGGLSKTQIDNLEKEGKFPRRIPIGEIRANGRPARVAWLQSEIEAFLRELVARARAKQSA